MNGVINPRRHIRGTIILKDAVRAAGHVEIMILRLADRGREGGSGQETVKGKPLPAWWGVHVEYLFICQVNTV